MTILKMKGRIERSRIALIIAEDRVESIGYCGI